MTVVRQSTQEHQEQIGRPEQYDTLTSKDVPSSEQRQRSVSTRNTTRQGADDQVRTSTAHSELANQVTKGWMRENEVLQEADEYLEEEKHLPPSPSPP